jgi:hypothetical protein
MSHQNGYSSSAASSVADPNEQETPSLLFQYNTTISECANWNLSADVCKEWVEKRGFAAEWVAYNVLPMGIEAASDALGYVAQSKGVWIEGEIGGGQFRPDVPWASADGKSKPKYRTRTAKKGGYDLIFPAYPGEPHFWGDAERVRKAACWIDGEPYVILSEGGAKAISGCANVAPTVGAPGVEMALLGKDKDGKRAMTAGLRYLVEDCRVGIIIAFDADTKVTTQRNVGRAQASIAKAVIAAGGRVRIATGLWKEEQGKGMDDFIQQNGAAKFREQVIDRCQPFSEKEHTAPSTRSGKLKHYLAQEIGDRLSFNMLKGDVLLDGARIVPGSEVSRDQTVTWFEFRTEAGEVIGDDIGEGLFIEAVLHQARQNCFHPVVDYLESVKGLAAGGAIDELTEVMGLLLPIERKMMRKHLIGSVARMKQPGCKYDTCPVQFTDQGGKKTTLWEALYGQGNFTTLLASDGDKDTLMKSLEYGEIEGLYKKKDVEHIKNVLSTREDTYRPPYERVNKTVPRSFVFVGSTNSSDFLRDDQNRRFWMLTPTRLPIDLDWIRANRDRIWAEAYQLWEAGEQYWFEYGTEEAWEQEQLAKEFQQTSVVKEKIVDCLLSSEVGRPFTLEDLLTGLKVIDSLTTLKSVEITIAHELKKLGFVKKKMRNEGGSPRWYWMSPSYKWQSEGSRGRKPQSTEADEIWATTPTKSKSRYRD